MQLHHSFRIGPKRGVYEEEITPPGERWFKIVLSSGKVGLVHFPDELVDAQFIDSLRIRLDAKDPVKPKLKAI